MLSGADVAMIAQVCIWPLLGVDGRVVGAGIPPDLTIETQRRGDQ